MAVVRVKRPRGRFQTARRHACMCDPQMAPVCRLGARQKSAAEFGVMIDHQANYSMWVISKI